MHTYCTLHTYGTLNTLHIVHSTLHTLHTLNIILRIYCIYIAYIVYITYIAYIAYIHYVHVMYSIYCTHCTNFIVMNYILYLTSCYKWGGIKQTFIRVWNHVINLYLHDMKCKIKMELTMGVANERLFMTSLYQQSLLSNRF